MEHRRVERLWYSKLGLCLAALACGLVACAAEVGGEPNEIADSQDYLRAQGATSHGVPSTKASAFFGDIAILHSSELAWTNIMTTTIKTSNGKTLFINPSLECGLYTETNVRSQRGRKDTSSASASIEMQVLVDGVAAQPGVVIYCSR